MKKFWIIPDIGDSIGIFRRSQGSFHVRSLRLIKSVRIEEHVLRTDLTTSGIIIEIKLS